MLPPKQHFKISVVPRH